MSLPAVRSKTSAITSKAALAAGIRGLYDTLKGIGITTEVSVPAASRGWILRLNTLSDNSVVSGFNLSSLHIQQNLRDAGFTESVVDERFSFSKGGLHVIAGSVANHFLPDLDIWLSHTEFQSREDVIHAIPESLRQRQKFPPNKNDTLAVFSPSHIDADVMIRELCGVLLNHVDLRTLCSTDKYADKLPENHHSPYWGASLRTSKLFIVMRTLLAYHMESAHCLTVPYRGGIDVQKFDLLMHAFKKEMTNYMSERYFLAVCKLLEESEFNSLESLLPPDKTVNVQTAWNYPSPLRIVLDPTQEVKVLKSALPTIAHSIVLSTVLECVAVDQSESDGVRALYVAQRTMMSAIRVFLGRMLHGAPKEVLLDYFPGLRASLVPPTPSASSGDDDDDEPDPSSTPKRLRP